MTCCGAISGSPSRTGRSRFCKTHVKVRGAGVIKAAFFDIDGTLVGFKTHRVAESTWRAIERMRERGIKVIIASGRSMSEMQDELKGRFDAYVTMNGQLCFDAEGTYRDAHIDDGDVRVLVEQAREGLYDLYVMQGVRSFVNHRGPLVEELGRQVGLEYELGSLDMAFELPVYQFNVFGGPEVEDVFLSKTEHVVATRWNKLFCDVIPAEGGKDYGVRATLERYDIAPEEAVAFGDGENDLSMFDVVGTSVAMGNAWDIVKERASHITTDVDDDGIWNACAELRLV
ncbi:Cof-type HAD-IIB family hydrolase [Collinsella sp. AF08-23]|nr:Cof-type HAD-IIB family hydrolase [Collinsella sp. AF08-23]